LTFALSAYFLIKKQKKLVDYIRKNYIKYGALFLEFELDQGRMKVLYYPYFFLRRFVIIFVFYNLSEIPGGQVLISIGFSFFLSLGLWKFQPFQEKILNILCIFNEVTFTIILALISSFLLNPTGTSNDALQYLAMSLVSLSVLAQFIVVVYAVVKAYQAYRMLSTTKSTVVPDPLVTKTDSPEKLFQSSSSLSPGLEKQARSNPYTQLRMTKLEAEDPIDIVHNVSEQNSLGSVSYNELSEDYLPSDSQSVVREILQTSYARQFDEEEDIEVINLDN
jgi:hypothetical protein